MQLFAFSFCFINFVAYIRYILLAINFTNWSLEIVQHPRFIVMSIVEFRWARGANCEGQP